MTKPRIGIGSVASDVSRARTARSSSCASAEPMPWRRQSGWTETWPRNSSSAPGLDGGEGDQCLTIGLRLVDEPAVVGEVEAGEVVANLLDGHVDVAEVVAVDGRDQLKEARGVINGRASHAKLELVQLGRRAQS